MARRERRISQARSTGETLLWAWLFAVATASLIGAVILFFLHS
jgi:hypothetical protein